MTSRSHAFVLVLVAIISLFQFFDAPLIDLFGNSALEESFLLGQSLTRIERCLVPTQGRSDSEVVRLPLAGPRITGSTMIDTEKTYEDSPTPGFMLWASILVKTIYQGKSNFV